MASERRKAWLWAAIVFVAAWAYAWVLSHFGEGWTLVGIATLGAAMVTFVLKGGLDGE